MLYPSPVKDASTQPRASPDYTRQVDAALLRLAMQEDRDYLNHPDNELLSTALRTFALTLTQYGPKIVEALSNVPNPKVAAIFTAGSLALDQFILPILDRFYPPSRRATDYAAILTKVKRQFFDTHRDRLQMRKGAGVYHFYLDNIHIGDVNSRTSAFTAAR